MAIKPNLLLVLAVVLLIVYLKLYFSPNPNFEILQMNLDKLTAQHLFEKSPILITDQIVDPLALLTTVFSYAYSFKTFNGDFKGIKKNKAQYLLCTVTEDSVVMITHPIKGKYDNIELHMKKYQVLILPYGWSCKVEQGKVNSIELDTAITYACKLF